MSIRVLQHLPGFIDGDPIDTTVEKVEDILMLDFIHRWTVYPLKVEQWEDKSFCNILAETYNQHTKETQLWAIAYVYHPIEEIQKLLERK